MAQRIPGRKYRKTRAAGAPPLESAISGEIVNALRRIGCEVSSTQQRRRSEQTVGMPDLFATHAAWGVMAWIEVKRPGQKPSPAQLAWHTSARAAGAHVLVVTSAAEAVQQFGALPRTRRVRP